MQLGNYSKYTGARECAVEQQSLANMANWLQNLELEGTILTVSRTKVSTSYPFGTEGGGGGGERPW